MHYKSACLSCAKKISRRYIFLEPTFYHRCRGCGARCRMGVAGYLTTLAWLAVSIVCLVLFRKHLVSATAAVALVLGTSALVIWLFPYVSSAQLAYKRHDDRAA